MSVLPEYFGLASDTDIKKAADSGFFYIEFMFDAINW